MNILSKVNIVHNVVKTETCDLELGRQVQDYKTTGQWESLSKLAFVYGVG